MAYVRRGRRSDPPPKLGLSLQSCMKYAEEVSRVPLKVVLLVNQESE